MHQHINMDKSLKLKRHDKHSGFTVLSMTLSKKKPGLAFYNFLHKKIISKLFVKKFFSLEISWIIFMPFCSKILQKFINK